MPTVAIIGLQEGLSALHALSRMPTWTIHTLCDLDRALLAKRQADYGLHARLTNDFTSVIADPNVDVIAIFTPDALHVQQASASLDAGKHVMLTKPIALSTAEAHTIQAAVERNPQCVFFAGHTSRFIPSFMDQYQDYRDGNIGRLLAVETEYHADKRQRAVHLSQQWGTFSPLSIWLVHPVDLAVWYLGEVSESSMTVTQSQHFRDLRQGPDNFVAVLQNKQQTIGLVKGFYTSPQPSTVRVTLRGEQGYSTASYPDMHYSLHSDTTANRSVDYSDRHEWYFPFGDHSYHVGEMAHIFDEFLTCITDGRSPSVGIAEGVTSVAVLESLQQQISAVS